MIGVIVPAHNEERELERCPAALRVAAGCPALGGEAVRMVTSARRNARASGGFGDTLLRYAASARAALPSDLPVLLGFVE